MRAIALSILATFALAGMLPAQSPMPVIVPGRDASGHIIAGACGARELRFPSSSAENVAGDEGGE